MPLTIKNNNQQQQKQLQVPKPQQTQSPYVSQKSPYQQNVANVQPQQNNSWFKGTYPTTNEIYGRVYQMWQKDPNTASQVMAGFSQAQQDSSSPWYNPYMQATNQAVSVLQSYGIDTNMLTDEWFQNNTAWQQSLRFGNTTNTPLAPLKNATDDQIVAFNLYQYQYSEPTTKKAEQEWAALQQELTYKATRKDRNYSDDDIINSIDWNKYQTLKAMNDGKTKGAVTELNRAVNFSDDSMRGVLWAARNGGSSGNIVKDMAMYGLGEGNKWVEDPEMRAKLAWGNPETYSPYQVGMTLDEEVGMYFNVPYIDRQTLNHLRATIDDSDKTSMSMFNRAAKSVENAEKAQEQRDKLYAWIDKNIGNKSEEWLLKNLDVKLGNKDYAMLKAMDESIDNGSDLVQMGTAVDYRKQDVIDYIRRKKAELGGNGTAPDIANGTAGSAKTKEQVQQEAEDIHRRNRIKDPEYTGTEKDAYDSVNGEGAYQRDIAAAESLTSQSQAQKDSDQYVNDTVGDIEDELTPGESSRLNGYSGASDQAQQTVKANKDAMVSGEESPDAIIQKNNEEITKGWIEGTVDIYPRTIKYEQTQANLDFAKKQIEEINAKLGDKVFAGQTQDTSFTMEINGDLYRITLSPDLSEIEGIDNVNKSDTPVPVYASFGLYDSPEEYDADTQVWDAVEKSGQVEAFREKYAQETEKINAANKLEITDEDRELMKLKRQYEIQVEDNEQYLRDYKNQYDADITVFKRLSERRAAHIQNLKDMGASTTEVETADAALNALTGFTSYEATQWDYYNPSYAYAYKIENGEDRNTVLQQAEAEHEEMLEQIKDVEWLKGYCDRHNIEIGNDVRRNMDRRIAKLQRDTQDYEYFRLQFSDDFDKVAEEQRKIDEKISSEYIASHVMNDTHLPQGTLFYDFNGYDRYLTDDEKNTWYYLKAKDEQNGTNKAEEYAKFMTDDTYGVLMTRAAMGIEEGAKALTGQEGTAGLGFTAGNITAVLLSPYTAVASGIYRAKTLFTGKEINPNSRYLQTTKFRSAVREQSAQEILETFGKPIVDEKTGEVTGYDSNLLSKGVQMFYEMLSNRADSMINAASFGWMFGGIGNNVLRELLSASPMGMSAGMEATARAKERGATDAQASAIGLCTFLAETGTEAISLENMSKAFEIGEITGPGSYKQFLVNWLTKAGISEMVGESTNDIVENLADEWIMGELSEHAETVYQYRLAGMSANEAELAARKDEVKGVLRTALMSYLTPGLDVFQTMRGRMGYFSDATDKLNAENPDKKLTVRQVRKQIIEEERSEARKQREKIQKQKQDAHEPGEIDYDALEERYAPEQTEEEKAAEEETKTAEEEAKVKEGKQNTVDFEILETAKTYDKAGKSAAIAAVLDEGSTQDETDTANAASVRLDKIMGPNADPSSELQDLLLGAKVANGDISTSSIKQGIMYSALGGEQSQSRQVMQSDAYQKATPAVKATMLAEAAQQDAQNPDVVKNVANAVREDRIAKQMGVLMANGAAEKIGQAEVKVDFAKLETQKAQKGLDTQRGIEKTARKKQQSMVAESVQNPNNKQMAQDAENAMRDLIDQAKVTREYEQSVKNAQQREDDAVRNAEKVRQKTLSDIRKQAEQYVAQEDQQRAAVAEQQRVEQEQQAVVAEQQRIAQEEKSNATNADAEAFIEKNLPNGTEEDKQKIREMFKKISTETPTQETRDQNGNLTAEAVLNRGKVLNRISKKFNIRIDEEDTTHNGTVSRQNGYYDVKNNRIVIDRNTSLSDAMFFVLGHELTHVAEKSSTYKELANALLKIAYGDGADYESIIKDATAGKPTSKAVADILARKALYDERLAEMHKQDNSINGDPITYEEALQEVVADITGKILNGDENLINQLASKTPGIARRIIESIKNFVKKARGIDGEWKTKAQNAVDLLEKALKDAEKQTEHKTKFSLPETTVIASDDQGDALAEELPGGTVAINTDRKYSLSSFSDEEQKRVRQALLDSGRFSKEQVDKYLTDALGIASIIAADRVRLDFNANPAQRFLKPNNDYYFTLDASTLCAKRLLYQGTFDYVQHALPDEVFTPEDLIELVNIMSEMGYETPCGICYVESRRRWLDTYAQEFLDKIQKDPDGFIEKRFKKASDEEKAALRERFAGEMPSVDDLTTSDGLEKLRNDDPLMHKAFVTAMNAKGTANPKVVQLRTEYSGDIRNLTEKEIQKVKDIGGLRIQSFSDFETPHLLDMVQAVMDMASVGLTSQAYTKVANFAWVFGDTGIKINLSLIGKGTGLDADGNLVFDDVEGMPFEEAMKLRERYSKNVGTILVGINDEHIIAAMADPRIDFIIPFHKSGWSDKELKGIPSLNNYQDYTDSQNEKKIKGRNKTNDGYDTIPGKESKLVNFQPVGKNGYWEFDKSGEWNARKYLQMCAKDGRIPKFSQFLVDNGDGSFSLPEGDDKRSVAIRTGYWKTLIDFKMYDNDGNGAEQTAVTPNINMDQAQRVLNEHKLGRQMPTRKDGSEGIFIPVESNNDVPVAIPAGDEYIRRIIEKRRGIKPTGPNDSLEATPVIEVSKLGKSAFHQNDEMEQGVPNARSAAMASNADLTLGNTETDQEDDYSSRQEAMAIDPETGDAVRKKYSLPVTDKETLDFLDKQEREGKVIRTYRTMKLLDGKLVSPKATLINGKVEGDTQLGQWEAAAEHPELVKFDKDNGEAYFELKEKGSKSPIKARYNPYMHSSNLMLNDQFKAAYQYSGADKALGKFVTVECIVPESEASSGYHAQYAKDPVGWTNWKAGGVAQKVEQQGGESRKVFLSRWIKPIRIVPDSEVAQHYKKLLDGKNIEVPANVVTPGLLSELEKAGVKIGPPEKQSAKAFEKMTGRKYSLGTVEETSNIKEKIDQFFADMAIDELADLFEIRFGSSESDTESAEEKIRTIVTNAVEDIKDEFDPTIYGGRLYVKPETMDYWFSGNGYAAPGSRKYSKAYITMMNPADFLRISTTEESEQRRILSESKPLNQAGKSLDSTAQRQPIQLIIDQDTWKVVGHEGRHRATALARAGVTQMPVVLVDERDGGQKTSKQREASIELQGQDPDFNPNNLENGNRLVLKDVIPIREEFEDEIRSRFTASAEEEADAAQKGQRILRYSLPSDAPYMAAVERGEMDEAQKMVDEKAREAGYDVEYAVWRGDFEPYTELEPGVNGGNLGTGLYFTPNKRYAEKFATKDSPVRKFYLKKGNTFNYDTFTQEFNDYALSWMEENDGIEPGSIANIDEYTWSMIWDDFISENGYDSVEATGVGGMSQGASEIAVQGSWQAKLADPVTYDDAGNVIPLSERFNDQKDDIRYSLPSDDILEDMIKQYLRKGGVLSENEDVANRDAALVKDGVVPLKKMAKMLKTDKGEGTRQWGTGMAQNMDELADQAGQFVLDHSAYQRDTNKAQIDRAVAWVKKLPTQGNETIYDKAVRYVTSDAFRRGGARTADGRAKLAVVMGMAVARNDVSAQVLIADMTNKTATNIGQALQAQKLFKLMTPEGRIGTLQRMLDDQKVALQRRGKNAVAENLKFSDWVIRAAGLAETEADMKQVRDAALNELAQQIPMNWKDRINSFRMLSMLANPRTHIRNVVGNALFVPAVGMKNKLAAIAEAMTLEKGERTKTLAPILNKSIREFARQDAMAMKDVLTGEAKYNESGSLIGRQQKGLSKINGDFLEKEDWLFLKGHYRRALGGWMQANGYTVEDVKNNHQLLEKGRAYAIEEAQKATYRDFSKTADALNKISKQGGALGFVVDAALPFKKTPINILRRGIEYSPVGIAKGLKNLMFHMNEYTEYQKALEAYEAGETTTAPVMPDKAVSPNQVIDQICSGLSGTAVMALGFLLAGCGAVTCGLDDDEDKFDKAKGEQEYSIKLFGTDVSMTIDWAAPMCMPFFVGAAIRDQAEKENLDIEALINAFGGITEPVFNLSMLDGVNTLLKTNSYDKTNPIAQIGSKLALNYAGSFVPSFLGAVARTYDDKQRKAFVPGDQKGVVSNAMYTLEQAQNKVPIWNQQNIAARNIWGEEKTSSFIERLVENFISPGYFNKVEDDPIINEMGRLYDVTGDNKMIPDEDPDKKITFTKDKVKQEVVLTDKQWDEYKKVRGQTAKQELTELINSESYQNASDSAKLQMMKDVWSHADKVGKNAVVSDIEVDNKPVGQIAKESKISGYESEMIKYLNDGDFEDYDNAAEAIRQEYDDDEEADAEIRQKLMNYYREMYKKAYRNGGLEGQTKMNEIEEALEYTGLVDESDFMRWQNAVDKALDDET